jgi:hypothetical protein
VLITDAGFELEAHVAGGALDFIGFSGRGEGVPATPMIAPPALEALRTAGEPHPVVPAAVGDTLGKQPVVNALRVCLDEAGAVQSIAPASGWDPTGVRAFTQAIADWKFRPFAVGDEALAVCAIVTVTYPPGAKVVDRIPLAPKLGPDGKPRFMVEPYLLEGRRIVGHVRVDATALERERIPIDGRFVATFRLCLDEHGVPASVDNVQPSGLASYDARVADNLKTWRYHPFVIDGQPSAICTMITYALSRHAVEILEPGPR